MNLGIGLGLTNRRRSSSFSPLALVPSVFLRGDNLADGLVSTWVDQSGNGNNCTAAGGDRPTAVAAQFKAERVVRFDGTDRLQGTAALNTTALTIWAVITVVTAGGGQDAILDFEPGTSTNSGYLMFNDGGTYRWRALDGNSGTADATFSIALATPTLIVGTKTGTTLQLYEGATLRDTESSAPAGPASTANYRLGMLFQDALPASCDIAEVGVLTRVITASEILSLNAYANARYIV